MNSRQVLLRRLLLAAFLDIPIGFVWLGGGDWLSLENFQSHKDQLLAFVQNHFWPTFLWGLVYAVAVAFSLPSAALLSLITGFLFGRWLGTVLIVAAAGSGAVVVFLLARYLFADAARQRLQQNPGAAKILAGFERDAARYLLFLRLVLIFPFWLVNLAAAFAPMSLSTYAWTTIVGIIPASFVFANLGRSLGEVRSLEGLLSPPGSGCSGTVGRAGLVPGVAADHWPVLGNGAKRAGDMNAEILSTSPAGAGSVPC